MHLARRGWSAAWGNARTGTRDAFLRAAEDDNVRISIADSAGYLADAVACVGLLHDVGHPPMSHILEADLHDQLDKWVVEHDLPPRWDSLAAVKCPFHEFAGSVLLRQIMRDVSAQVPGPFLDLVQLIYDADPDKRLWPSAMHSLVASEVDVDRLDYLMRDGQHAGTEFGGIDYQRLVDAFELTLTSAESDRPEFVVVPQVRARSAVETMLMQRTQSYRWIFFHHRVVGSNMALIRAFRALAELRIDAAACGAVAPGRQAWELFRVTGTTFNYLAPKLGDLETDLKAVGLTAVAQEALDASTTLAFQTRIHDGRLLATLEEGRVIARALVGSSGADPELVARCRWFLAYCNAALSRGKTFWPAWKTVEEWTSAVADMWDRYGFQRELDDMFALLGERLSGDDGALRYVEHVRGEIKSHMTDGGPLAATNLIVDQLFHHRQYRKEFTTHLAGDETALVAGRGRWHVAHNVFRPVRDDSPSVLVRDDGTLVALGRESPMVRALERVDATRVRLSVFFFPEPGNGEWDRFLLRGFQRGVLVGAVARTLPAFVRITWGDHLEGLARARSTGESVDSPASGGDSR